MIVFNLNDAVFVKLTDLGYQRLADLHNRFLGKIRNWEARTPEYYKEQADANGFSRFQAWDFIQKFGPVTGLAMPDYYDTSILINKKDLREPFVTA